MASITRYIAASGDDTRRYRTDTVYPLVAGAGGFATDTNIWTAKQFDTPNYDVTCSFFRFDTSSIPDDATVSSAIFRVASPISSNANARDFLIEWYPWTTVSDTDYADLVGSTAAQVSLATFVGGLGSYDFTLSNSGANVSKTGFTGLRCGISGAAPTGVNEMYFVAWDHATADPPRLLVEYIEFQGSSPIAWTTA